MHKIFFLTLSSFLIMSHSHAAVVNLLCPDGSKMQQSKQCAPDAGCWPAGVNLNIEGSILKANIDVNGSITIDNKYLGKVVKIQSQDNFWSPKYCPKLGAGVLFNRFNLQELQTVTMNYQPR